MRQKGGTIEMRKIRHWEAGDRKEAAGRGHWKRQTTREVVRNVRITR
jgi:hypothetical protein